jgi:hypothetical protein
VVLENTMTPRPRERERPADSTFRTSSLVQRLETRRRLLTWTERARARVRHRSAEELLRRTALTFVDASLNTEAAFEQRQQLRRHPIVSEQLRLWWRAAVLSVSGANTTAGSVDWPTYRDLYRLLFASLDDSPQDFDASEADEAAQEDWARTSVDGHTVDEAQFQDSIFEVR